MQLARYVKFREEKFGGVLFQTQTERVFTLNPSAVAVVREIRPGAGPESIVESLRARFQDPDGSLARDVHALIADLRENGLVTGDTPRDVP